jgi:integrase
MFSDLADQYLVWSQRQRSYRTSKKYLVAQLRGYFGQLSLRSFTTKGIEDFQSKLLADGKSAATVNRYLATLKHTFTKAHDWDMCDEGSLKRVRRVKKLEETNARLRYLSKEECAALLNACPSHLRPIVVTALHTEMRKDEILSLRWDRHIDLPHGLLLLDTTKDGERREIPISPTLRETLQGIVRRMDSPYVFADARGKRFLDVKRSFHSACRRAGIRDFRFHDLRHTFASHLVMAGFDLKTVQELLGHSDLRMTIRYVHLAPRHRERVATVIEQALGGTPTIQKLDNENGKGVS